jgi:hypothetical protein
LSIISTWYKGSEIYTKILSVNEMYDIYNFIVKHEVEEEYEYRINPDQEFENNLYAILNFLDDYIVDKDYLMPILGVRKTLTGY